MQIEIDDFEWDDDKEESNIKRHGVSFHGVPARRPEARISYMQAKLTNMREEYDFSNAVCGNHAERMRKHGYTTTVHHRDGSKTVTRFPPKQDAPQKTRTVGEQFLMEQLRTFHLRVKEPVKKNGYDFLVQSPEFGESHSGCPVVFKEQLLAQMRAALQEY